MTHSPLSQKFLDLPETIPVFPLTGALLLPGGYLPLNIFEPRYLAMVDDALKSDRLIGMIQPRDNTQTPPALYDTGCAGRITDFTETTDGRYLITLSGVCRFKIAQELDVKTPYRRIRADWKNFEGDFNRKECLDIDRPALHETLKEFLTLNGMDGDWDSMSGTSDNKLITCLSMVSPFEPKEKQALLEAPCCASRARLFMTMLEMAVAAAHASDTPPTRH